MPIDIANFLYILWAENKMWSLVKIFLINSPSYWGGVGGVFVPLTLKSKLFNRSQENLVTRISHFRVYICVLEATSL